MVADTYTPRLGAIKQGTGNNNNSWGTFLNGALENLDKGIAAYVSFAVTGGNLAKDAVIPPAGPHPLGEMIVNFTGILASDQTVTVPNVSKVWLVENGCTGAFTLKFKTTGGVASSAIPQNGMAIVICDGADNMFVGLSTSLRDVQWLGANGTIAAPAFSFAADPDTGIYRKGANLLGIVVGGVEIAVFSATGLDIAAGLALTVNGVAPVPPGSEQVTAAIEPDTGWYFEYGQTVTRLGDAGLFAALTKGFTADTNNTTTLSNVSVDLRNKGLEGSALEGTGMATNAVIVSIAATSIVMSIAATNTAAAGAVRAFPYGNGDGSTTFVLPDARGTVAAGRDNMGLAGTAARGKLTTAGSSVDGTKLLTDAGSQNATISRAMLPNVSVSVSISDPGHAHTYTTASMPGGGIIQTGSGAAFTNSAAATSSNVTGISASFNLNNNVTQVTVPTVMPVRIRNVMIKR